MSHTIAAVSTGNQVSAIGIIRMTGDDCIAIADKVFTLNNKNLLSNAPDRKLLLGQLHDKQGRVIDSCCALVSRGPRSYTGEDTVEFHCHGSPAVLAAGLEAKGIRCEIDTRSEKIGYKIREAQLQKIPYMLIVGEKEAADNKVSVRSRDNGEVGSIDLNEFISTIIEEIETRKNVIQD